MEKPTILTARTSADLLAAVPCILGFEPEESLVMLTFGSRSGAFHARVDLPHTADDIVGVVDALVSAAVANQVRGVAVIAYTDDGRAAGRVAAALAAALTERRIGVHDMLLVDHDHYWPLSPGGVTCGPQRFDAQSHRFRAEAVMSGRVVHGSRAELAATLAPQVSPEVAGAVSRAAGRRGVQEAAEGLWLRSFLPRLARARALPSADEAGRLLVDLEELDLLDVAMTTMDAAEPDDWLDLWSQLVRAAPDPVRAAPAALLAFAAWRAGQGALAWCAIDRCRDVDPDHALAGMVAQLLERAVPPSAWTAAGGHGPLDGLA